MMKLNVGQKPLRLLLSAASVALTGVLMAGVLTGCGGSKYEAVELTERAADADGQAGLDSDGANSADVAGIVAGNVSMTMVSLDDRMGNTAGDDADEESADSSEALEADGAAYQDVNDRVAVTTDVLNVRQSDDTSARIYVQLKTGDILERTGYNDEWCRVLYDGEVGYVAADMVEVVDEAALEAESAEAESLAAMAAQGGLPDTVLDAGAAGEFSGSAGLNGDAVAAGGSVPAAASALGGLAAYSNNGTGAAAAEAAWNGHVVAIDAGHQAKANAEKEPIGPSSQTMKAKMPEGAVGTATGVKEYELTLTVAQKLESELKARGYQVVMVRTSHDVNLSDAERAVIANNSDAEIFIRLHANSMENSGVYGALAMCMTEYNPYNASLHTKSYTLSKKIIDNICSLTGTKNRGVQKVDNSSAINWSEIPVSVVEMGFLSNPDEDRWLQSEDYQAKIVSGIAAAVDSYFAEGN